MSSTHCRVFVVASVLAATGLLVSACAGSTVPVSASAADRPSTAGSAPTVTPSASPSVPPTPEVSPSPTGPLLTEQEAGEVFVDAWCPTYDQVIPFQAAWETHVLDAPPDEPLSRVVRVAAGRAAQAVIDEVSALDEIRGQWPPGVEPVVGSVIDHELGVIAFLETVHDAQTVGEALAAQELAGIPSVANLHSDVSAAEELQGVLDLPPAAITCDVVF